MNSTSDSVTTFSSPNFIEISPLKQLMAVVTGYYSTLFFVTFVSADEANTIHLKCNIATSSSPCSVLDHQVPVFICNKDALSSSAWDVTTQQVSNFDILTCTYTCLLQHLRCKSHGCGSKTSISGLLTPVDQFLMPSSKLKNLS